MPDDDLSVEPQEPTGYEPAPPNRSSEPSEPAPTPTSLTADQIQQAMAGGNQPVLEAINQLAAAMTARQKPDEPAVEPSELAERLLTDPKAILREEMNAWGRENLAAPMSRSFEVDRDERIETRAAEIDTDWGDGFFDANIRLCLTGPEGNLSAWPINQQADPKVIDAAVNAILGNDFRDPDKRSAMQEALAKTAKAKQERDVANAPHMMGPGRPMRGRSDKLTPEHQEALAGFRNVGVKLTEADIKAALTRENTLEAYRASKGATQ